MDCDGGGAGTGADGVPGAGSDARGKASTAGEADLWDSGKVLSPANLIEYAGERLASEMGRLVARAGLGWRKTSPARTARRLILRWACLRRRTGTPIGLAFPAPGRGRRCISGAISRIEKPVRRARIYMAGLGYSELRVNGKKANERVLDPPQTDYSKRVLYSTDAVETLLRPGNNTIGVICGSGWFGTARLLLQMHIDYSRRHS